MPIETIIHNVVVTMHYVYTYQELRCRMLSDLIPSIDVPCGYNVILLCSLVSCRILPLIPHVLHPWGFLDFHRYSTPESEQFTNSNSIEETLVPLDTIPQLATYHTI